MNKNKINFKLEDHKHLFLKDNQINIEAEPFGNGIYYSAQELASIYNVPKPTCHKVNIAVIAIKGGFDIQDAIINWTSVSNIPVENQAQVNTILLDGETGDIGVDITLDLINATSVQMIGGVAPSSKTTINLYITGGTIDGIVRAIKLAIKDCNSVILYPYPNLFYIGSLFFFITPQPVDETEYTKSDREKLDKAFKKCVKKGITVCVPSGDLGAPNGIFDGETHVQFPASSPYVLTCGGTVLLNNGNFYTNLTIENNWSYQLDPQLFLNLGAGGGVSKIYKEPKYQKKVIEIDHVDNINDNTYNNDIVKKGRVLPDVASCGSLNTAGPASGIIVTYQFQKAFIGSTFVSAAFFAGFIAAINFKDFIVPYLYKIYENKEKREQAFHDITIGYNGAYKCEKGFDLCTGMGSINGVKIKKYLSEIKSKDIIKY